MDREKIEAGVRLILEGVGEDPDREGLLKTPERVAKKMCIRDRLKAVQSGAKTICLQKGDIVLTHGGNFGAINSRFQKEAGNPEIDMMDILAHHLKYNNYRPQYDYAKVIFNESAETLEWIADSTGLTWNPSKPRTINTMDWDNTCLLYTSW